MNSAAVPGIDAGRRRRQLPVEVSAFVGRADELGTLDGQDLKPKGKPATTSEVGKAVSAAL